MLRYLTIQADYKMVGCLRYVIPSGNLLCNVSAKYKALQNHEKPDCTVNVGDAQ